MFSPIRTKSGFIGQSQHCYSLASCGQCSGTDLLPTEMRIAEGVESEWLGCCTRFLRAELNISECSPWLRSVLGLGRAKRTCDSTSILRASGCGFTGLGAGLEQKTGAC